MINNTKKAWVFFLCLFSFLVNIFSQEIKGEYPKLEDIIDKEYVSSLRENNKIVFSIECSVSKGTYIRSLVRDIAYKLNTVGIMSKLRRIKQGNFLIND